MAELKSRMPPEGAFPVSTFSSMDSMRDNCFLGFTYSTLNTVFENEHGIKLFCVYYRRAVEQDGFDKCYDAGTSRVKVKERSSFGSKWRLQRMHCVVHR